MDFGLLAYYLDTYRKWITFPETNRDLKQSCPNLKLMGEVQGRDFYEEWCINLNKIDVQCNLESIGDLMAGHEYVLKIKDSKEELN